MTSCNSVHMHKRKGEKYALKTKPVQLVAPASGKGVHGVLLEPPIKTSNVR